LPSNAIRPDNRACPGQIDIVTRSRRSLLAALAIVAALAAAGFGAYFITDGRAKERSTRGAPPPAPVSVAAVTAQTVPVRLRAIGNVEAKTTVAVKARVDGQIVAVNFKEGQHVAKGDILFQLDPRAFEAALHQAEANLARDQANADHSAMQERRYADLLEKNFISKDAYAQFRTNADTAGAVVKASRAAVETARLNLQYCTIRSPIDGFAGRAMLQLGNVVKANDVTPLVIVNQVRPIYVMFAVPEQALGEIRRYMAEGALPVTVGSKEEGKGAPLATGRLGFIDNSVDTSTGTIKLRAEFDNRDLALWPGQFVTVSIELHAQQNALAVPTLAVQNGPQGEYVFVLKPDSTVEVRKVTVARVEGDLAVVAEGLAAGEQVVTRGQLRLVPGAKVVVRNDPA
jgi:multidrug efflux system membrane fusion protein